MNSNAILPTMGLNPQRYLPALMAGLCTFMVMSLATGAQPAAVPQSKPTAAPPSDIPASRFVGPEALDPYLAKMLANLAMNGRRLDPLGQIQDPNAKPLITKAPTTSKGRFPIKATPFTEIIGRIKVTTIMPSEDRFLVGSRSYKKGDRFDVTHKGRKTKVEVTSVEALKIDFKNIESGEVASVKTNLLPPGMKQGADGISAPGMIPDQKNTGIDVDSESNF